ncbi:unnamed protein product [Rhizophagus irregularis]|nr:unnamed protein product [Rhizophagus irregularis]
MNSSRPLVIHNNIDNEYQYCKGCEKNLSSSLFITDKRSYRTCITCRIQNKEQKLVRKQKVNAEDADQIPIELTDLCEILSEILDPFENIERDENENQENVENHEFTFSCTVNIAILEGSSKEKANQIINILSDVDEYTWIYHHMYEKKSKSITYYYHCSQWENLGKKARKHSDSQKHRDRQPMKRYACNGCIKITIYEDLALSNIEINHLLHPIRPNVSISTEIKQFILENINLLPCEIYKRLIEQGLDINVRQKQVHFWRDKNPFLSAKKWLKEKLYEIIFQKEEKALGFLTKFWDILINSQFKISEIGVNATYNTNNLKFELYVVHAEIDGMGFPLAYLFLENGNCGGGIRTGIIIDFFLQLKIRGLEPEFFLTDKDFSQISAARFVWKNVKIQLCLWHIKKAVETRLGNNKNSQQINYNGEAAHQLFSFIDPSFQPIIKEKTLFCPKELRSSVWNMMNNHLHQHPLIPTIDGKFLSSTQIWTEAVQEIYNFCQQNSLPRLWSTFGMNGMVQNVGSYG